MRWRPIAWFALSLCLFAAAVYFWRLGNRWSAEKARPANTEHATRNTENEPRKTDHGPRTASSLASNASHIPSPFPSFAAYEATITNRLAYRLANTPKTVGQLVHSSTAVLLENALVETGSKSQLAIPGHLRAQGEPGSYIVQSRTALDSAFRALLQRSGATIVAYIPNNAYLVRASAGAAQQLRADPHTQSVLPYEPYYKLKPSLLKLAVEQQPMPENTKLNLLLFADARQATVDALKALGAEVLSEDPSPFGPVVRVRPAAESLPALAGLPGVQEVEPVRERVLANDLSRARIGVAADSQTPDNYLGLTGTNIIININDTGVSTNHADFAGRILLAADDFTGAGGYDRNGHGTHVAGTIAGNGSLSATVTNASGSIMPGTNGQFRGMAPYATLLSLPYYAPDFYLQQTAARTNAFISNNSWHYGGAGDYDLAAASFDAAARDALPMTNGSQPVLFVFGAGNNGSGGDDGLGGNSESIQSPGTAKNIITVGAIEQPRNITNKVWKNCRPSGTNVVCTTNTPWLGMTDSQDQVAALSARGNVGVGYEGDYGRFKPDVVAPGTFVVSTRSPEWDKDAYYNPTNYHRNTFSDTVETNSLEPYSIFIPANAVQFSIRVFAEVDMPIFMRQGDNPTPTVYDPPIHTNRVAVPPDRPAAFPTIWFYSIGNPTNRPIEFTVATEIVTTNDNGNYFEVLSNLNETIGPYYRYESGTSMAAADVSGTLGLLQEFFQNQGRTNGWGGPQGRSPALFKAMLINGARSANNDLYDLQVTNEINFQGWGLASLPNTLPLTLVSNFTAPSRPVFLFDQDPATALATGQRHTWNVKVSQGGQTQPLRTTLVWTDPPGNPAASIKLVNDLDLVITNLDTGSVYFGNDITAGNNFNRPWDTNAPPSIDAINNVENIFILPPLATNGYSITVSGHHVNVNAVSAHTNDVVQDYALVISSGNGQVADALSITDTPTVSSYLPTVTVVTNQFTSATEYSGGILFNQHVGANAPLLDTNRIPLQGSNPNPWPGGSDGQFTTGLTNQWHFYVLSNDLDFTNAAFVTIIPPSLSMPRMGVTNVDNPDNAARVEADIDLYVSTEYGLTNLDPGALARADKSLGRSGTEFVALSNVQAKAVYYVGVKSEDQQAAEYTFFGVFSLYPFSTTDENGNMTVHGIPVPAAIPDGSPAKPGAALVFGIGLQPLPIRRAVVTVTNTHENIGDIYGTLTHNRKTVVLNSHSFPPVTTAPFTYECIYEDNGERNVTGSQHTDGPGSLKDFIGEQGVGLWLLTTVDNALTQTGRVDGLAIKLEPQDISGNGSPRTLPPDSWTFDFIDVPVEATNLTVCVTGNTQPVELYLRRADLPTQTAFDYHLTVQPPGDCLSVTPYDTPPLTPGRYYIGVYNPPANTAQTIRLFAAVYKSIAPRSSSVVSSSGPTALEDDAVTYAYLTNWNHHVISGLDVGLLLAHERISDLAITLISPSGTRVLLFQDRGGTSTNGLGTFGAGGLFGWTNMAPFYTNGFELADAGPYTPGAVFEGWNVLTNVVTVFTELPAPWLSNNVLILDDGEVSLELPTTNSTSYHLSFDVTHAPYLVGTIGWWPLDHDGRDIFGGHDGYFGGDVLFVSTGRVGRAYYGDGVATRMTVPASPDLNVGAGRGFSIEGWIWPFNVTNAGPLVEWNTTNGTGQGVQFWLTQQLGPTNGPGCLTAVLWDTNSLPHSLVTSNLVVTNGGWQHVALTYDASTLEARIYTNGHVVASAFLSFPSNAIPRTTGDLFFGYHPASPLPGPDFRGGMDEFGLYDRALTACEVGAIFSAGQAGKYGTNVLSCPVALQLTLVTTNPTAGVTFTFTNGLTWTNGPQWETDAIDFPNPLLVSGTNGVGTNWSLITLSALDPNATVDNFVLSSLVTNYTSGLMHFSENTNRALIPIKFAPYPYAISNFPPLLMFSNDFESATQAVYTVKEVIPGTTNSGFGPRDWTVTAGPVTVLSNAFFDAAGTNWLALSHGAIQSKLPTVPGHRYELSYSVRGPAAVGWWTGDVEPLSRRAWDVLGNNHGAFINNTTTSTNGFVYAHNLTNTLWFPGLPWPVQTEHWWDPAPKVELGDPANLRLTNSFTIEGWINPVPPHTNDIGVSSFQQIFFRGDARDCRDPYFLAISLDNTNTWDFDLVFHVEKADSPSCGAMLMTGDHPIKTNTWQHIAAVFDYHVQWTENPPWPTNQLRLYLDGKLLTNVWISDPLSGGWLQSSFTSEQPFADLEPSFQPGVTIGNASRYNKWEPFCGYLDELSVYGRALTEPEIAAIADLGSRGKADPVVSPAYSLAKVNVLLDNALVDVGHGDNFKWTTRTLVFTASRTNTVLDIQGLLPGTLLDGITLTELPAEMDYLPEDPLSVLDGEDAYGVWRLEIWDTRAGGHTTNSLAQLLEWQLDFTLLPRAPQPVVTLEHGIFYTNSLAGFGYQNFIVPVPQWAAMASNALQFASRYRGTSPLSVNVLFDTNQFPYLTANALPILAGVASGWTNLTTTNAIPPQIASGQSYFLTVTNPNAVGVTFAFGVSFDITTLSNCVPATNYFVGPAGIPRYFQFDVPNYEVPPGYPPQSVFFWLAGAQSNLTVVLSQHLPLPDLGRYDYISQRPGTNDEIIMVLTNTTAFPLQTNRWYVGVFGSTPTNTVVTNIPFTVQACFDTNAPIVITLTNGVPYTAEFDHPFVAPPGPPRTVFFRFPITNWVDSVLFELYNLSGDADLVLDREIAPTMAPYWAESFRLGTTPEQIVVRSGSEIADLRYNWYLGVYNNELTNVAYTIRAVLPQQGILVSGLPIQLDISKLPSSPNNLFLQWNSVEGEAYLIEYSDTYTPPVWKPWDALIATTPYSTFQVPIEPIGQRFFRIRQVSNLNYLVPPLHIQRRGTDQVRLYWSAAFPNVTLQHAPSLPGSWNNLNHSVTLEGAENAVYDTIGATNRFYRLVP